MEDSTNDQPKKSDTGNENGDHHGDIHDLTGRLLFAVKSGNGPVKKAIIEIFFRVDHLPFSSDILYDAAEIPGLFSTGGELDADQSAPKIFGCSHTNRSYRSIQRLGMEIRQHPGNLP